VGPRNRLGDEVEGERNALTAIHNLVHNLASISSLTLLFLREFEPLLNRNLRRSVA